MTKARPAHPHVDQAERYVADVLSGKQIACEFIRLACERHVNDKLKAGGDWPYRLDHDKAEKACRFMERFPHVKGRWANKHELFVMSDWQAFYFVSIFGWVHKTTGFRRFRKARLYVPRKAGKSLMVAPLGLYMLTADGEAGAEVFSGATSEKQAWEIFGPALQMAKSRDDFRAKFNLRINAKSITSSASMAKFEPVIGNPGDGSNPHCALVDEYHEHATDALLATMETGMGAREQPLSVVVSTAGDNIAGPCREDWLECIKVLQGIHENDQLFAMVFTIDKDTDWTSEAALRMANPNIGISPTLEFLQEAQRDAINNPRKQGHFKTKHLNLWVQARDAYFDLQKYREAAQPLLKLEQFRGRRVFLALDLASKIDLCALEILIPMGNTAAEKTIRFGKYYIPRATVDLKENEHYRGWEAAGWLTVTEGNMTDYFQILEDIKELSKVFDVADIAYDPHNATMLVTALMNEGLPMTEFGATVLNFSDPMKHVDGMIRDGMLVHNGDPVAEWSLSNVVAKPDRKDNVYPTKETNDKKIDPTVALIMATGRHIQGAEPQDDFSGFLSNPVVVTK